ncbi:MAG: hypothetical protein J5687_07485 [Treponema sp.]|nr:hypothetical protein [Treponema sp.]
MKKFSKRLIFAFSLAVLLLGFTGCFPVQGPEENAVKHTTLTANVKINIINESDIDIHFNCINLYHGAALITEENPGYDLPVSIKHPTLPECIIKAGKNLEFEASPESTWETTETSTFVYLNLAGYCVIQDEQFELCICGYSTESGDIIQRQLPKKYSGQINKYDLVSISKQIIFSKNPQTYELTMKFVKHNDDYVMLMVCD